MVFCLIPTIGTEYSLAKGLGTQDRDVSDSEDFHFLVLSVRGSREHLKPRRVWTRTRMASEDAVVAFNVQVEAEGLQGRSKLEKAMQEWLGGEGQRLKFVLWGPGGTGKSTLALQFAAAQVEGAGWSSVRLVFALSRGSMAQGYAGLLGESCVHAGRGQCLQGGMGVVMNSCAGTCH